MKFSTSIKMATAGFEVLTAEDCFKTERTCRNYANKFCDMLVVRGNDGVWYYRRDEEADTILDGIEVEQIQVWKWDNCDDGYAWRLASYIHINKGWREIPNPEATIVEPGDTDIEIDEEYLDFSAVEIKMVPMNAIKTLTHAKKSLVNRLFNH